MTIPKTEDGVDIKIDNGLRRYNKFDKFPMSTCHFLMLAFILFEQQKYFSYAKGTNKGSDGKHLSDHQEISVE